MKLICGDSLQKLKDLPSSSVDAVVTDPPYGWRFMGKAWDGADIEKRRIEEFNRPPRKDGKSRGQGDPSMCAGLYDTSLKGNQAFMHWTKDWATEALRVLKPGGHMLVFCGPRTYHAMAMGVEMAGFEIRDQLQWLFGSGFPKSLDVSKAIDKAAGAEREVIGPNKHHCAGRKPTNTLRAMNKLYNKEDDGKYDTTPATDDAKQWQGYGTALKPANEPIVLARKPLEKGLTVAENVLKWGTGALAIDASRIGNETIQSRQIDTTAWHGNSFGAKPQKPTGEIKTYAGRWPANVLLDEEAAQALDAQTGKLAGGGPSPSRFFYVAKASKRERGEGNNHPTVKPIKLMEYLIQLVTRPGAIVLDPFMGSGTTGCAAVKLKRQFIGIEREKEYIEIAKKRIGKC